MGPNVHGISTVAAADVCIFCTGMSAIWNAHARAQATRPPAKSVCSGYVYEHAFCQYIEFALLFPGSHTPIPSKSWKYGVRNATSLALAQTATSNELDKILEAEATHGPTTLPILLFSEFPSSPLPRFANLGRLCAPADKYNFLIVIDETIRNFVNVKVLPYADNLGQQLNEGVLFSRASNIMGSRCGILSSLPSQGPPRPPE